MKMATGKTRQKKKAKLMVEKNQKDSNTSFADYGAKEILKDFTSSTIGSVAMVRNEIDYTRCDIFVLFKGRINLNKGKKDITLVKGKFYVYENCDIHDWREIRKQALIGNSMGKVIGKTLVESNYDYSVVE